MNHLSLRHRILSEQLNHWWGKQDEFKTRKAMADVLKVHPDTLGDYFRGRRFPNEEIASRLWQFTSIECLEPGIARDQCSTTSAEEGYLKGPRRPLEKGQRGGERSVIVSLHRTDCPFCGHAIKEFRDCLHCGQHFVWANLPMKSDLLPQGT